MTEQVTMNDQELEKRDLLQKLGFKQPTLQNDVSTVSIEEFEIRIEKLQNMSSEEFCKVLKLPLDKIADFEIKLGSMTRKCSDREDCEYKQVDFKILFQYDINGFKTYDHLRNPLLEIFDGRQDNYIQFISTHTIQRAKAGYFLLESTYEHHSEFCGTAYQTSAVFRSPFSLLIPNYYHFLDRVNGDPSRMYIKLKEVLGNIPQEVNLNNHYDFIHEMKNKDCPRDHQGDYCDYEDCDQQCGEQAHSETEYCERFCKFNDDLDYFLTHPHYFVEMDNFCTGSQFDTNQKLRELKSFPNPISYLSEIIRMSSDVNFGDCFKRSEYYVDVFENWHTFSNPTPNNIQTYYSNLMYSNHSDKPSQFHTLHNECYCFDCVQFKRFVLEGLKFDPTKMKFAEFPEKEKDWFIQWGKERDINPTTIKQIINIVEDIDLNDPKYHISDKSKLNFFDSLMEEKYHPLGIVKGLLTSASTISIDDLAKQFQPIRQLSRIARSETDYTTVVHDIVEEFREKYQVLLSDENIKIMLTEYTKNMLK